MSASVYSWRDDLNQKKYFGRRTEIIREWIQEIFPDHIPFVGRKPFQYNFALKKNTGRPRQNKLIVGLSGSCAAVSDGCKTIFDVGFSESSKINILKRKKVGDDKIELEILISGCCKHIYGKKYGSLVASMKKKLLI